MILLFPAVLLSFSSLAAEPLPPPTFDGVTYLQWGMNLSDGANSANAFDLTRVYFGARQELGDHLATRVLFDAGRGADNTKEYVFIKNAFVEWKDPAPDVKLQAGMIGTPYIGYTERFWGHRYAILSFTDEYKLLSSADLGIGAQGTHADGIADWGAALINGEGYGKPEVDATKTLQTRLSLDPLADGGGKVRVVITAFGSFGTAPPDTDPETTGNQVGDPTLLYTGALGFKMDYLLVWAEYTGRRIGAQVTSGHSTTVMSTIPEKASIYVRYDNLDPDGDTVDDAMDRVFAGVSHDFYRKVSLALQYDSTLPEAAPDVPTHGVYLKAQAGF